MPETPWHPTVCGVGVVGEWHVKVLRAMPDVRLPACCDVDVPKARAVLDKLGLQDVPVYPTLAELFDQHPETNVVHVTTPSGDHETPAVEAMRAGRHVVCEKPMEIALDRIDRMIAASEQTGRRLAGIFQNRWNPLMRALRAAAEQHKFGTVAYAGCFTPWHRTDAYYRAGGWRGTWRMDGGGAIMNQSVHAVDLLQWIGGPVKTVSAHASSRIHPEIEVEDTLTAAVTFESGAHGVVMGTTAMWPGGAVRLEIGGERGTAVADYNRVHQWRFEGDAADRAAEFKTDATTTGGGSSALDVGLELHAANVRHIYDAWARNEEPDTNAREARKAVAIILALYESARRNGEAVAV